MRLRAIFAMIFVCPAVYCQDLPHPLTQVEACRTSHDSIVEVDTDTTRGTGFIVGSDGWIITALHVIANPQTLARYGNISVRISGHARPIVAEVLSPVDNLARKRDFAILKIDQSGLPSLSLGSEGTIENGSPIAIAGFPLSAFGASPGNTPVFCLAGTIAAQTAFPLEGLNFLHTIYFQGISVKGISGAPVISLLTGNVIGIVSTKLTGIGPALQAVRDNLDRSALAQMNTGVSYRMSMNGIDPSKAVGDIVAVLDEQLANGLGSSTGASDAAVALSQARKEYQRQHPENGEPKQSH